jgi:putative phosphoribosyl transferase
MHGFAFLRWKWAEHRRAITGAFDVRQDSAPRAAHHFRHENRDEPAMKHELRIPAAGCLLRAELRMAERPAGIVVLVHGSGTDRHDPLNRRVAASLVRAGFAALLVDLLEDCQARERHDVFDVETQAARLSAVKDWLRSQPATRSLDIGYFGTGVGAGVALMAAARAPRGVGALVARGGRPDTALHCLHRVEAPTLFIASDSGTDRDWVEAAYRATRVCKDLVHVAGAGDSFRAPGAIEAVAQHACRWFTLHLDLESSLKRLHPGSQCRVTLEDRPPHAYERKRFNVRLDVSRAGRSFVVNREHDDDPSAALREAFQAATRQLEALEAAGRRI